MAGTGYSDDALRISSSTDVEEILDFVERRSKNPFIVEDTLFFNYSTHTIDEKALKRIAPKLAHDAYLIPFQLGPVWGFMCYNLPKRIRELEHLKYDSRNGTYAPHKNFLRTTTIDENEEFRKDLADWVVDNTDYNENWEIPEEEAPIEEYL